MPATVIPANLVKVIYSSEIWYEALDEAFVSRFIGGEDSVIHRKSDFLKEKGTSMKFGLQMKMASKGVYGDAELEGQEEKLVVYDDTVTIDQLRNAFELEGRIEERKAAYNMRESSKRGLKDWLSDRIDSIAFNHLAGDTGEDFPAVGLAPSSNRDLFAGVATTDATITSACPFTASLIDDAVAMAQVVSPRIRPVKIEGQEFYVLFLHTYQARQLRRDPDWQSAHYLAHDRGLKNPIFTGSMGIYNKTIIYDHPKVYFVTTMGAGSDQPGARAAFCGRQSLLFAEGGAPTWNEKTKDHGNKFSAAIGRTFGVKKAVFNLEDYAVITIASYAEQV